LTTVTDTILVGDDYAGWLAKTGLADTTKTIYPAHVRRFLTWLGENLHEHDGALEEANARNYAVRDYRRHLLTVDKLATATVELHVSAITSFYEWRGLGKPDVKRASAPRTAPKALSANELRRVLRAAERRGVRDYAIAAVLFYSAIRVSECAALDVDDLLISERSGMLHVRAGKGDRPRQVPFQSDGRAAVRPWLAKRRADYPDQSLGPLFLSRTGERLSKRRIQGMVAELAAETGLELSAHVFRHTFARLFLEGGGDLGTLKEILGHTSLASTQVYTRPTATSMAEMMERVSIDL
jgi:site-specific recombinase XerC